MASEKKTRGPNKGIPWSRAEAEISVLRLALDVSDPVQRRRVEAIFATMYQLRRALQRGIRRRVDAYWAAPKERKRDGAAAVRARLRLSREALERDAYRHLDRAPRLRRNITKALAMHLADSIWVGVERNLFGDSRGRRQGRPRPGRWFDFTRIPGRARSHTTANKWETLRLHGTLAGHRAAYTTNDGRFFQPRRMRQLAPQRDWWRYEGPLAMVFTGLPGGTVVLPVRLPSAPANQAALEHHLSDPERWHKIDLVRHRDPGAEGGWRYEAHLLVLTKPYVSPRTQDRRVRAALDTAGRNAGIDVNVSNVTVASHENGSDLRITRVARDGGDRERAAKRAKAQRKRQRRLDRSRRLSNPEQYDLSPRQQRRAANRAARGLPPAEVIPRGPRKARRDGRPIQPYRRDRLSESYRRERAAQKAEAESAARARREDARRKAAQVVLQHGFRMTIEDCDLRRWAGRWGRSLHAFSPGILVQEISREVTAVSTLAATQGGILRASTQTTALSQHCLCGHRVEKALGDRTHRCPSCGLIADRDAVAAVLGAFVRFEDPEQPRSATVDFEGAASALRDPRTIETLRTSILFAANGRQDAQSESNAQSASPGSSRRETERTPEGPVARRIVGTAPYTTPDETGSRRTTLDDVRTRPDLSRSRDGTLPRLRDIS